MCLESSDSKCKHLFSMDDNINNCIFFTNSTSTFNCSSLWYFVDDSILAIMYETQALMSGLVTLHDSKSLSMRRYNNPISFSDILGESASNLNLWSKPECGIWPGIDISLMMCERFFVSFHVTIRIDFHYPWVDKPSCLCSYRMYFVVVYYSHHDHSRDLLTLHIKIMLVQYHHHYRDLLNPNIVVYSRSLVCYF